MSRRRRRRVIAPAVASTFLCLAGRWPASQGLGRRGAGEASDRGWSIVGYNDSGPTASNVRMRDGVGQYACEPHGRTRSWSVGEPYAIVWWVMGGSVSQPMCTMNDAEVCQGHYGPETPPHRVLSPTGPAVGRGLVLVELLN